MEKRYIASHIMFFKRLQWVDEDDIIVYDDEDDEDGADAFTEGGWSPPEAIPASFPPSISGGGLLTLCLCVFDLRRHSLDEKMRRNRCSR
jgi:hypothetical protein